MRSEKWVGVKRKGFLFGVSHSRDLGGWWGFQVDRVDEKDLHLTSPNCLSCNNDKSSTVLDHSPSPNPARSPNPPSHKPPTDQPIPSASITARTTPNTVLLTTASPSSHPQPAELTSRHLTTPPPPTYRHPAASRVTAPQPGSPPPRTRRVGSPPVRYRDTFLTVASASRGHSSSAGYEKR
ncbi:hypothetical protein V497_02324 [Pseudogymnoascus sp. VKM F-4516 (FW-969)]|nr:hypothetical protein V497_02324 [Pseudogymnoascus sp. VKM F-4516 (FW-969)]